MYLKHKLINVWLHAALMKGDYFTFLKSAGFHRDYHSVRRNYVAAESRCYGRALIPSPRETCKSNAMWQ